VQPPVGWAPEFCLPNIQFTPTVQRIHRLQVSRPSRQACLDLPCPSTTVLLLQKRVLGARTFQAEVEALAGSQGKKIQLHPITLNGEDVQAIDVFQQVLPHV